MHELIEHRTVCYVGYNDVVAQTCASVKTIPGDKPAG